MLNKYKLIITILYFLFLKNTCLISAPLKPIVFSDINKLMRIGNCISILEDKSNVLPFSEVYKSKHFEVSDKIVPNLGVTNSTFWIKFSILNTSSSDEILLEVAQPTLNNISLLYYTENGITKIINEGISRSFNTRFFDNQNYLFNLTVPKGTIKTYYIKLNSSDQVMLPISLGTQKTVFENLIKKDLIFGIFLGSLLVMLLYNLFIYFTVRDPVYLYYVVYILLIILVQGSLQGYTFKYLWSDNVPLTKISIFIFPALANISATFFTKVFLRTRTNTPSLNKVLNIIIGVLLLDITLVFIGLYRISFIVLQLTTIIGSLILFYCAYLIIKKGYRPAKFFLVSWSFLLAGAIIFVLKDFAILPYNNFTSNSLQIGSALEVILLSFALADKINIYKKEKEQSQAQTLSAVQENERMAREQNVILERNVEERTSELVTTNKNLNKTLTDLKEAQMQLVEAEKMASLGQLTAGIAHEINNPINFVTSNIAPLRRDVDVLVDAITNIESVGLSDATIEEKQQQIDDYKEEIELDYLKIEINHLLNGIHEGATRTADIVKGLKIFSRLDEDDLKKADINEGLDSTLIIANNLIGNKIQVIKSLGNVPVIECYPGKLNQVFLNIISNAVFAIQEKFNNQNGGLLEITTTNDDQHLTIRIKDNGTGMTEATKNKIFEPFFTTKNVGVGTGLGMSIVYNTIKKHNAEIYLNSTEGIGTEFIIKLNLVFEAPIAEYESGQQR